MRTRPKTVAALVLTFAAGTCGQSTQPAAFVANNGNLEGSVTSFTFSPAGAPVFVQKFVTGTAPSSSTPNAGNNAYAISISPNGRWLAVTHATSSTTVERITVLEVHPDATMTYVGTFDTPDSPLDNEWLADDTLVVTKTSLSAPNQVIAYRFTPPGPGPATMTQIDAENAGTFTAYVVRDPFGLFLYAGDSSSNTIWWYLIYPDGTLDPVGGAPTGGIYPLGPGISRNGEWLYAGGGISGGANKILGFTVATATGVPFPLPGSPYISPGTGPSPKLVVTSSDDAFAFVGHGSSAAVRSFAIDPQSGALTDTGFSFDVGIQGSLGDAQVLGDLLLITDNFEGPTGLYAFTIHPDGSFTMNGGLVSTQGTAPRTIAVWSPATCYPDCNADGVLDVSDFGCFTNKFIQADPYADCNADGVLDVSDFGCYTNKFIQGCG